LLFNRGVNIQIFCDNEGVAYISISFYQQEAQLLLRDHAMRNVNSNLNANRNPNSEPNSNDPNHTKRNLM